jgi:ATP-dependent DNA ligase
LVAKLAALTAKKFALYGEIVIPQGGQLSFDALPMRIHPAASRIKKLSGTTPSVLIVFDLLVDDRGESLVDLPLKTRQKLEQFAKK